jgi:outer membrane protein assembly factor BamB
LGAQELKLPERDGDKPDPRGDRTASFLVCLSVEPAPGGERVRWKVEPSVVQSNAIFEGAPVVEDGRVYIAATRVANDRTITAIHCYSAQATIAPPLRWRQDVCETRELKPGKEGKRTRHHLLTLAGPNVVYCSHSGAVIALDALSGRRTWAVRYPSQQPPPEEGSRLRDLSPCVFAAGRLYVAPADSDLLLCLDPADGRTLWERQRLDVVHLLGVGEGRLIFTTPKGLRAVNAVDGGDRGGWLLPDDGTLAPMGRGMLIGDLVLWPTAQRRDDGLPGGRERVYAVRQRDGRPVEDPTVLHGLPAGNLVYANGCLAVADRAVLSVFVHPALRLEQREKEAEREPGSPAAALERARSEADAGLFPRAMKTLERAEALVGEVPDNRLRQRLAREQRELKHRTLLDMAGAAEEQRRWDDAASALRQAATAEFQPAERVRALRQLAHLWEDAKKPVRAIEALQAILNDGRLRDVLVPDEWSDLPIPAAKQASGWILKIRADPAADEAIRKEAEAEYARLKGEKDPLRWEEFVRRYPSTYLVGKARVELGRLYSQTNQPAKAAQAYRSAVTPWRSADDAEALAGLARAYEAQQCWDAARECWVNLASGHPDRKLPELDARRTVKEYVAAHLKTPPFDDEQPSPRPEALLRRQWQAPLEAGEAVLAGDVVGLVVSGCALPEGGRLRVRDAASGKVRFSCDLPFVPEWAGTHADLIVVGGSAGVACVRRTDGGRVWECAPSCYHRTGSRLHGFQIYEERLFFLLDQRQLVAVNVETGEVQGIWSQPEAWLDLSAPHGRILSVLVQGGVSVLVQTASGRSHFLDDWDLDPGPGVALRPPLHTGRNPWPRPVRFGVCLAIVTDARHVVMLRFNLEWVHTIDGIGGPNTLSGEMPFIVGGGRTLLLVTPTNVGDQLQRLDVEDGKPVWKKPPLLPDLPRDPESWAVSEDALYYVRGSVLCARSLEDGKLLWEQPLSGSAGPWRLRYRPGTLLAYPARACAERFQFRWLRASLQWGVEANHADERRPIPVVCVDPRTGTCVQRLNLAPCAPARLYRLPSPEVGQRMPFLPTLHWDRDPASEVRVRLTATGVVVSLPGQIVGFGLDSVSPGGRQAGSPGEGP